MNHYLCNLHSENIDNQGSGEAISIMNFDASGNIFAGNLPFSMNKKHQREMQVPTYLVVNVC